MKMVIKEIHKRCISFPFGINNRSRDVRYGMNAMNMYIPQATDI